MFNHNLCFLGQIFNFPISAKISNCLVKSLENFDQNLKKFRRERSLRFSLIKKIYLGFSNIAVIILKILVNISKDFDQITRMLVKIGKIWNFEDLPKVFEI